MTASLPVWRWKITSATRRAVRGSPHSGLGCGIDIDPVSRTTVKHTLHIFDELGVPPLCEGVETVEELMVLTDLGVSLIQG